MSADRRLTPMEKMQLLNISPACTAAAIRWAPTFFLGVHARHGSWRNLTRYCPRPAGPTNAPCRTCCSQAENELVTINLARLKGEEGAAPAAACLAGAGNASCCPTHTQGWAQHCSSSIVALAPRQLRPLRCALFNERLQISRA